MRGYSVVDDFSFDVVFLPLHVGELNQHIQSVRAESMKNSKGYSENHWILGVCVRGLKKVFLLDSLRGHYDCGECILQGAYGERWDEGPFVEYEFVRVENVSNQV